MEYFEKLLTRIIIYAIVRIEGVRDLMQRRTLSRMDHTLDDSR